MSFGENMRMENGEWKMENYGCGMPTLYPYGMDVKNVAFIFQKYV
jgi:hypothetical protein